MLHSFYNHEEQEILNICIISKVKSAPIVEDRSYQAFDFLRFARKKSRNKSAQVSANTSPCQSI